MLFLIRQYLLLPPCQKVYHSSDVFFNPVSALVAQPATNPHITIAATLGRVTSTAVRVAHTSDPGYSARSVLTLTGE